MILEGLRYQLGLIFAPKIRHWMTTFCLQTIYFSSWASSEVWNYRSKTSCMEVQNINNSANYSTSQQYETIFAIISVRWPNFQQPIFHAKIMALMSLWIVYYDVNAEWNQMKWAWVNNNSTESAESTSVVVWCQWPEWGRIWDDVAMGPTADTPSTLGQLLSSILVVGAGRCDNSISSAQTVIESNQDS